MDQRSIILFDGVCNLCNSAVQFVIKHDKNNQFLFASLQSEEGIKVLSELNYSDDELNTFILLDNNIIYTRSTAALRVAKKLGFPSNLLYGLMIIPKFIRDAVYKIISKNRYKWFGKKDECIIPTKELKAKFLNQL